MRAAPRQISKTAINADKASKTEIQARSGSYGGFTICVSTRLFLDFPAGLSFGLTRIEIAR